MLKYKFEALWGVLFIIVLLLWMYFEKAMGWHDVNIDKQAVYTNIFAFVAVLVYFIALYHIRKAKYGGTAGFRELFISGIVITLVAAVLSPLAQYLVLAVISPEFLNNSIIYAVKSGNSTPEEAKKYFNLNSFILMAAPFALVTGVITAAFVAFFLKNSKTSQA